MIEKLRFDASKYIVKTCKLEGRSITYRAFEGIGYCAAPVDPIQKLNLFVPEEYYHGEVTGKYQLNTAPIFMPNTVGGYLPGPPDVPGFDHHGNINSVFRALEHGYIVACAGVRGRTSGSQCDEFFEGGKAIDTETDTGRAVGKAPALIVDMKAAVRYLRYNRNHIPGDVEKIITNGTSAGGALSALMGASGNSPDYEEQLRAIGAMDERDDVFAAGCYCPIHNLEHADMAYEWLFGGHDDYSNVRIRKVDGELIKTGQTGRHNDRQKQLSQDLKVLFPSYLNSLSLKDDDGSLLSLDQAGDGSFKEYIKCLVLQSARREASTHDCAGRLAKWAVGGSEIHSQDWLTIKDGIIEDMDWDGFVNAITRMKPVPAFDALDLNSPENEEFGTEEVKAKHFTDYSAAHSEVNGEKADLKLIKMLNPVCYLRSEGTAGHWRIRHGIYDRDTSLAIPVILATLLRNKGYDVDFFLPWGMPHSGDYDLDDLFKWIDRICKE